MEFLDELDTIKEVYYPGNSTRWISRHLEGEVAVWRKVIKRNITCYEDFCDAFREKFWSQQVQAKVRDRLEYGKYRASEGWTMTQYLERLVLECRQLIPVMSDRHSVRKIARHYSREIEIAVLTRGISEISGLEVLL